MIKKSVLYNTYTRNITNIFVAICEPKSEQSEFISRDIFDVEIDPVNDRQA